MTPIFDDLYQTVIVRGETLDPARREEVFHAYRAASRTGLTTIAVLLAQSQLEMASRKAWLAYAEEATGLTRSECYHRAKVGKLLLDLRDNRVLYRKLITLTGAKLLAISRIPVEHIPGFLAVTDVATMEIKEVRFEVEKELYRLDGKPLPVRDETPELPGFADLMDGITALGDKLSAGVCDDDAAEKTMQNGLNLCTCAISYEWAQSRKHGYAAVNRTRLLEAKATLLDQLNSINALLEGGAEEKEGEDDETLESGRQTCRLGLSRHSDVVPCSGERAACDTEPAGLCDGHTTADSGPVGPVGQSVTGQSRSSRDIGAARHFDAARLPPDSLCDEHTTADGSADDSGGAVRPTAARRARGGDGAGEVPRVLPRGEAAEPDDAGHDDRGAGGGRSGGGVSDPAFQRPAR